MLQTDETGDNGLVNLLTDTDDQLPLIYSCCGWKSQMSLQEIYTQLIYTRKIMSRTPTDEPGPAQQF